MVPGTIRYIHSAEPGDVVVPRALYYRYLGRIVVNLVGIMRESSEPTPERRTPQRDLDE